MWFATIDASMKDSSKEIWLNLTNYANAIYKLSKSDRKCGFTGNSSVYTHYRYKKQPSNYGFLEI